MKRRAFTLMELLAVIVILGILITIGSRGLRAARVTAQKAQARVEMKSIETAVKAYLNTYAELPVIEGQQGAEEPDFDEAFSRQTIQILSGIDTNVNVAGRVYLEPQRNAAAGAFLDPWGSQYLIGLDTDYDNVIDDMAGESLRRNVAIVARGLYLQNASRRTNDLIRSWD